MTPFSLIFEFFLSQISDDLYSIFDEQDTENDLTLLLSQAVPNFRFPRQNLINSLDISNRRFNIVLNQEEINIITALMKISWLERKIADQRIIHLEYSDKDFSLKSQQAHLKALNETLVEMERRTLFMQNMYNRRTLSGLPNYDGIAGGSR